MDQNKAYTVLADVTPGPTTSELIVDNKYHVSEDVWAGKERNVLECSCGSKLLRNWEITDAMEEILELNGFGAFRNVDVVLQNDSALVTALVERWRGETNTFFMRLGEMTPTLEDVGYILGLPLFGEPLTCGQIQNPEGFFYENWFEPLTAEMRQGSTKRKQISLVWLHKWYSPAPTPGREMIHTKAYILFLCGTVLFPTSSQNVVHPRFLRVLQYDTEFKNYAWGAAVLAYLYRALEFATHSGSGSIAACLLLLQIWSYERLLPGRPRRLEGAEMLLPLVDSWAYCSIDTVLGKRRGDGPAHNLDFYRSELDGTAGDVVHWTPYSRFEGLIDDYLVEAEMAGLARVPLICFDIVEYQHPDRVTRQFAYHPHIPRAPTQMADYRISRSSSFVVDDYRRKWWKEIGMWLRFCERLIGLVDEDDMGSVSEEDYRVWFDRVSRPRIGKPHAISETKFQSRELFDNAEALNLIESAMTVIHRLDGLVQPEFASEFGKLLPNFITPYNKFMRKLRGPSYIAPYFKNVCQEPKQMDIRQDVIDITQPFSQILTRQDVNEEVGPSHLDATLGRDRTIRKLE